MQSNVLIGIEYISTTLSCNHQLANTAQLLKA